MNYKYIILDFGNVLVTPASGDWHKTPKFLELVDVDSIDSKLLEEAFKKYEPLLGEKLLTLEEEYDLFLRYYDGILSHINYPNHYELAKEIAHDRTYTHNKYRICDDIVEELTNLKGKYTLILLTDNWPCVIPYLKDYKLYDFFDKIYISSVYGAEKRDKVLFDYPIKDYDIKPGEALFIDDSELNLDIAKEKGLDVMLMDRYKSGVESKHKVITDLRGLL